MAVIRNSGDAKAWRKKNQKKKKVTSAQQNIQGRGGVAPANYKPKAPADILPAKAPVYHDFAANITNAHNAYKNYTGKKPDAGQLYAMLSAAPIGMEESEWGKIFGVLDGPADPFTNSLGKTAVEYFTRFHAYPNAAKMRAFMEAKKSLGPAGDDTRVLFDALGGPTDSTDITLEGQAADKAVPGRKTHKWGWTKEDLESMDGSKAKADAERKLANTTIHGDEMDDREIFDIQKARGWYLGTDFKDFINQRQASTFYNEDGSVNSSAVVSQGIKGGHNLDSILHANTYVRMREGTGGKPRSALTPKQKERLSNFADVLALSQPNFWKHYGGSKKNLVWDEFFERAAMQYIFLYAAPYAMSAPAEREGAPPRKGPRKQSEYGIPEDVVENAEKLIEIASYGKIRRGDQLYTFLSEQGTLGMKNDIRFPADQVSGFKFYAFQKTAGVGMSDYEQLAAYAATFGPDDLPAAARQKYDTMTGEYSGLMNLLDRSPINPFVDIFEALIGGEPPKEISLGPGVEPITGFTDAEMEQNRIDALERGEKQRQLHRMGRGGPVEGLPAPEPWVFHVALPAMMKALDISSLWVDRAGTFAAYFISFGISGGYLVEDGRGGWESSGVEWDPTKADFWTGKDAPKDRKSISSISDIVDQTAKELPYTEVGETLFHANFAKLLLRDYGLDPEEHKTLLVVASLGLNLGVGWATDSWITMGAKGGAKLSARLARKSLSEGLDESVRVAEGQLDDIAAEAAAHYDPYHGISNEVAWTDYVNARRHLNLLNRPRWWDTHSAALARGEQTPEMLDKLLNINADQFHGTGEVGERLLKKRAAIIEIEKKIGKSRDADEIAHLFNELSYRGELLEGVGGMKAPKWFGRMDERMMYGGYGIKLDPGTAMLGRAFKFEQAARFSPAWDAVTQTVGNTGTILNGASKVRDHIESVGRALHGGGLDEEGTGEIVRRYMKKAHELTDETSHGLDLKRQLLWRDFMKEITDNLEGKLLSDGQAKQLLYWAKRNALVDKNMTLTAFKKSIHNGEGEANWLDGISVFSAIKNHQKRKGLGFNSKSAEKTFFDEYSRDPFLMPDPVTGEGGQLAKNLYAPFALQDMSAFIRGRVGWNLWQYTQGTALFGIPWAPNFIPSWMGLVNATRLLAVARMGFPLTAMLVDEIPRIPFEIMNGRMSLNMGKWYQAIKLTKAAGKMDDMSDDLLMELVRDADGMTAIDQSHKDYLLWLNGYTELLKKSAFTDDFLNFTDEQARAILVKDAGEEINAAEFREAFKEHLRELIMSDGKIGERLRSYLIQAHHLSKQDFISPVELARQQEAWRRSLHLAHEDYVEIKTKRNALREERNALREKTVWQETEETVDFVDELMPERAIPEIESLDRQIDELTVQIDRLLTSPPTISEIEHMDIPVSDVPRWKSSQTTTVGAVDFEGHYSTTSRADAKVRELVEAYYADPTPDNLRAARSAVIGKRESALKSMRVRRGKAAKDPLVVQDLAGKTIVDNITAFDEQIKYLEEEIAAVRKLRPQTSSSRKDILQHSGIEYSVEKVGEREWRIVSDIDGKIDISGTYSSKQLARRGLSDKISRTLEPGQSGFGKTRRKQAAALKRKRTLLQKQKTGTAAPAAPPEEYLYHGTQSSSRESIMRRGLQSPAARSGDRSASSVYFFDGAMQVPVPGKTGYPELYRVKRSSLEENGWTFKHNKDTKTGESTSAIYGTKEGATVSPEMLERWNPETKMWEPVRTPTATSSRTDTVTTFTERGIKGLPNKPTNDFMEDFLDEHFPIPYSDAESLPADAADALKVRISRLSDEEKAWVAKEARQQYREQIVAERGLSDEYKQLNEMNERLREMNAGVKAAKDAKWRSSHKYPRSNLNQGAEDYLDAIIEKFDLYATFPALYKSLKNGTPVSEKEMKQMLKWCDEHNLALPIIPGVNQNGSNTVGRIPGLSEWAEGGLDAVPLVGRATRPLAKLPLLGKPAHFLTSLGPYTLLDKMSNSTKRIVYIGNFVKQYDELIAAGFDADEALEVASRRALDYADTAMYSPGATPLENDLKGVVMFLPAYRQAAQYWARAFARNPVVMTQMREAEGNEALMGWMGPYSQYIPTPFWTSGANLGEAVLPGLTAPLLYPLRVANSITGFRKQPDGTYKYTGATKLDFIGEKIPFLSFMSKGVSPLSGVDDLMWGLGGEASYLGALGGGDQWWQAALYGAGIALRSDPEKKRRLAMNILQAQISRGIRPDMTAAEAEIAGSPWWYRTFRDWFGMERPEGLLAYGTRTFGLGKVNYTPNDLYDEGTGFRVSGGKEGSLWEEFWGDEGPKSMADADWEMLQCYGDEKKMNALLDRFPKYKEVYEFRKMNAAEKQKFLLDPDNLDIIPYVTGKNEYGIGGEMLSNADYVLNRKAGIIMRKSVDDFLVDVQKMIDDTGWSKTYVAIDKEYRTNLTDSRAMMMRWAKTSTTNPETRQGRIDDVIRYWNGWNGTQPGNLEEADVANIPWWIQQQAVKAGFDPENPADRRKWDSGFVTAEYYNRLKAVDAYSSPYNDGHVHLPMREGERPYYSVTDIGAKGPGLTRGIEGKYTQGNIYNKDYTDGLGRMVRISTALDKLMPAKYKTLFSLSNSMSYGKIKQLLKDREARDKYYYRKIAGQPGYYFSDPAASLEAVGIDVKDHAALNNAWQKLQDRYDDYTVATKGMDTWGDKYLAIRARYIDDVDRMYKNPALAVMRGGPAARIMGTYLGKSPDGINKKMVSAAVRGMLTTDLPHPEDIVDDIIAPKNSKDPEQFVSAHAWHVIGLAAIAYRQKLRTSWNETMDSNGSSPDSKLGKKYAGRLLSLVRALSSHSRTFRNQWEMIGGEKCINAWLDYAN